VGSDLGKAIEGGMNNTIKFADVPSLGVTVQRGPTMDGLNKYYRAVIEESPYEPVDVAQVLRDTKARSSFPTYPSDPRMPRSTTPRPPSTRALPS